MAKLIIDGITFDQAKQLAHWYEGQGEQDAAVWFEIHEVPTPYADVQKKNWFQVDKQNETVTMFCK